MKNQKRAAGSPAPAKPAPASEGFTLTLRAVLKGMAADAFLARCQRRGIEPDVCLREIITSTLSAELHESAASGITECEVQK